MGFQLCPLHLQLILEVVEQDTRPICPLRFGKRIGGAGKSGRLSFTRQARTVVRGGGVAGARNQGWGPAISSRESVNLFLPLPLDTFAHSSNCKYLVILYPKLRE